MDPMKEAVSYARGAAQKHALARILGVPMNQWLSDDASYFFGLNPDGQMRYLNRVAAGEDHSAFIDTCGWQRVHDAVQACQTYSGAIVAFGSEVFEFPISDVVRGEGAIGITTARKLTPAHIRGIRLLSEHDRTELVRRIGASSLSVV
jgi:hypothetical protein